MDLKSFAFEIVDGVAHVTLNQADRGNPLDRAFAFELNEIATECSTDPAVRAVLIDAKGRFFCVGGDLNSLTKDRADLPRFVKQATADLHMAIARFARMNAPVVMAVHALVAGADFVLASPNAKFYAAFAGIGLVGDSGASYYLPRRVGTRRATEFYMLNEMWSAEQAAANGLINRVVEADQLDAEAWALARRLAQGPTVAYGEMKSLLHSASQETLESQLELEARAMARIAISDDAWNAMRAVHAKQKPTFEGR